MMNNTLTDNDLEIVKSFLLPIQSIPFNGDNTRNICIVLAMATFSMCEHVYFGTGTGDAGFGDNNLEKLNECLQNRNVEEGVIKYFRYLHNGDETIPVGGDVNIVKNEEVVEESVDNNKFVNYFKNVFKVLTTGRL